MPSLAEKLSNPAVHEAVIQDSIRVLDEEVARKSGLTGLGIKAAYKMLKGVKKGRALRKVLEVLIPDFIGKMDPFYERYLNDGKGTKWSSYIEPHHEALADEFLAVTDAKVETSDSSTVRGTYGKLRPKARKEVVASMPAMAKMMEKYIDL